MTVNQRSTSISSINTANSTTMTTTTMTTTSKKSIKNLKSKRNLKRSFIIHLYLLYLSSMSTLPFTMLMVSEYFILPKLSSPHRPFGKWPHVFILLRFIFSFFSNRLSKITLNKDRIHNPLMNSSYAAMISLFIFIFLFLSSSFGFLIEENSIFIIIIIIIIFLSTLLDSSFLNILSTFPPYYRLSYICGGVFGELFKEILTLFVMEKEPSAELGIYYFCFALILLLLNWFIFSSLELNPSFIFLKLSSKGENQTTIPPPPTTNRSSSFPISDADFPEMLKKDEEHFDLKIFSLIYDIFGSLLLNSTLSYILNPVIMVSLHPFSHLNVVKYRFFNNFSMIIGKCIGSCLPLISFFNPVTLSHLRSNRLGLRLLLKKRKESSSDNLNSSSSSSYKNGGSVGGLKDSIIMKMIGINKMAFNLLTICCWRVLFIFGILFFGNIAVRFDRKLMRYEFSLSHLPERPAMSEGMLYCFIFVFSILGSWIHVVGFMYAPMRVGSKSGKRSSIQYLILAKSFGPVFGIIIGNCIFIFLMLVIQKS